MVSSKSGKKRLAGMILALALGGVQAQAQDTGFGCRGLLASDTVPSVEGDAGQFYAVAPDLMASNRIPDEMIAQIAHLSRVLEAGGTRLIYLPTPTKALGAPQHLPPLAADLGYDADLAATVYDETLGRMRDAGIAVVDGRRALRLAGQGAPVFFGPDPRPNRAGQQALAEATAQRIAQTPGFGALPKTRFVTLEGADEDIPSLTRFRLQQHCQADLPAVRAKVAISTVAPGAPEPGDARVVVVSSDMTGAPQLNFAGFLQSALGLPVEHVTVPGGQPFDAIASVLTRRDFARNRPTYLVWENPVSQRLGLWGDQPMAELIAAAGTCGTPLPLTGGASTRRLSADLSVLEPARHYTLLLDTDSVVTSAWFHAPVGDPQDNLMRTRSIHRGADAPATGRFFMPLTGQGATPARMEIETDMPLGPQPRLMACASEVTQ